MTAPKVTILVPNYKTEKLTKLCLRLLRKYTDPAIAKVVVIDNHSEDGSTEYLRQLAWITLIERTPEADDNPQLSHSRALDLALQQVDTPYVLSIHTDTIVKDKRWLEPLLKPLEKDPMVAGVGSWKLESKPFLRRMAKRFERMVQLAYYKMIGRTAHKIEGHGNNYFYLRSHCALYRVDKIRELGTGFADSSGTTGSVMHQRLAGAGYKMVFIPSETLGKYVDHLNHATLVLNPELGMRDSAIDKGVKRIQRAFTELNAEAILENSQLDV